MLSFWTGIDTPADPLLEKQWHLGPLELNSDKTIRQAGINAREAWSKTKGAGVVIGIIIIDDGVQYDHPDLKTNYRSDLAWDFEHGNKDPKPKLGSLCDVYTWYDPQFDDCHGTAVAGIAAARGGNGEGGSGVAPDASLAALQIKAEGGRLTDTDAPSEKQIAAASRHLWDEIDIKNMSIGAKGNTLVSRTAVREALAEAAREGRNKKGTIFVKAAGNDANTGDNCNFEADANSRFVITVGAITSKGEREYFSEPCSALFVTAPVRKVLQVDNTFEYFDITTTDLTGGGWLQSQTRPERPARSRLHFYV